MTTLLGAKTLFFWGSGATAAVGQRGTFQQAAFFKKVVGAKDEPLEKRTRAALDKVSAVWDTAATATAPGTLKVILSSSVSASMTQVGEAATITLQLANSAAPTAASFGLSSISVIDAVLYDSISGLSAGVAGVTLQ